MSIQMENFNQSFSNKVLKMATKYADSPGKKIANRNQKNHQNTLEEAENPETYESEDNVDLDSKLSDVQDDNLWQSIEAQEKRYQKEQQQTYKQILDEQIRHRQMLEKQGTMTQMEKSINRGELKGYKDTQIIQGAMIPGIFGQSPLRNTVHNFKHMQQHKKRVNNVSTLLEGSMEQLESMHQEKFGHGPKSIIEAGPKKHRRTES